MMGLDLLEATNEYWRKLTELDAAYRRGEVSLEEVDARVTVLMAELGQARRVALHDFLGGLQHVWNQQREIVLSAAMLGVLVYSWFIMS